MLPAKLRLFCSSILPHKRDQSIINLLWVRSRQEVRTTLNSDQVRGLCIREQLDLFLRIRN